MGQMCGGSTASSHQPRTFLPVAVAQVKPRVEIPVQAHQFRKSFRAWTPCRKAAVRTGAFILLEFCLSFTSLLAQDASSLLELARYGLPTNRVSIAVVPLENKTGEGAMDFWRFAAATEFGLKLETVKSLRLAPQASLKYGLAQLQKKPGDSLTAEEAGRLGEIIQTRYVAWGDFRRKGRKWLVSIRLLTVANQSVSKELTAISADWSELGRDLCKKILEETKAHPTKAEQARFNKRWTRSPMVIECAARARALIEQNRPVGEWVPYATKAIKTDPKCARAWILLCGNQIQQGQLKEAMVSAKQALKFDPELPAAHSALGHLFINNREMDQAEEPLTHAVILNPDDPSAMGRLAEFRMLMKDTVDAEVLFNAALRLSPFDAQLHANLGRTCSFLGKRETGLRELKEAERLVIEPNLTTEEFLAWGYDQLHETPRSIEHYEKALAIGEKISLSPARLELLRHDLEELKASLHPEYIEAIPPKDYTVGSLSAALAEKVSPEEQKLIIQPLTSTPAIVSRARELTIRCTNTIEKARALFEALAGRLDVGEGQLRTAAQVFEAWNNTHTNSAFRCQEYALLYIMMARAVGVPAYFVSVTKDVDGANVSHACAAIFDGDRALLVDPSYRWFGIRHQKFSLLTDLEATAEYLAQVRDTPIRQIAFKICPGSAFVCLQLAFRYIANTNIEDASALLPTLLKLDNEGSMVNAVKASLAFHQQHFDEAIVSAKQALETGWPPASTSIYMVLGGAYYKLARFKEARDTFRTMLQHSPDPRSASIARNAISKINFLTGEE